MIEYIKGRVESLSPAAAVLENGSGIGFRLNITLPTFSSLDGRTEALLYVHEAIREDAVTLYGFATKRERELFRALIGVSGVGAATAVIILSSLQDDELAAVISGGDVKRLKSIKGIGTKTAERIIVDLRDKIKAATDTLSIQTAAGNEAYDEALGALTMLGFDKKQSEKVLKALFDADPMLKVEGAVKKALAML